MVGNDSVLDWEFCRFLGGGPSRVYVHMSHWAAFHARREMGASVVNTFCSLAGGLSVILSSRVHLCGWVLAIRAVRSLSTWLALTAAALAILYLLIRVDARSFWIKGVSPLTDAWVVAGFADVSPACSASCSDSLMYLWVGVPSFWDFGSWFSGCWLWLPFSSVGACWWWCR
jgi:hypothetical protein